MSYPLNSAFVLTQPKSLMTGTLGALGSNNALSPLSCYFPYKAIAEAPGWGRHRKTICQKIWIF